MRPDGLARLERVALGLVDLPARDEHLREAALALAERAAVLERLQDPDRVAEAPLGGREVAAAALDPAEWLLTRASAQALPDCEKSSSAPVEPGRTPRRVARAASRSAPARRAPSRAR